ncbi:hypothetical protein [Kribbella monticola]|uniref:hypothetical protein n=1 Tax=Kribbella monticola TaxID=2185285 RepID=UPI000DD4A2E7|nr:hypothetical protein [Kribbella monticola]
MSTSEALQWRQPGDGATSPPRVSAVGYFFFSLICLTVFVIGPAGLVLSFLYSGDHRWLTRAIALVLTVLFGVTSVLWWRGTRQGRLDTKRLDALGYPATAEILSVESKSWGEMDGVELRLRISGHGFETFETTFGWKYARHYEVGARLAVLVEPSARIFEVKG